MKNFKRILSIVLAMTMVLAMGMTAFAAPDTNPHTITIKNNDEEGKHVYSAYQVFKGTYDSASKKLSDVDWGNGVDGAAILSDLKASTAFGATNPFANATTAENVVDALGKFTDKSAEADAFAAIVGKHLGTAAGTSTQDASPYTINVIGDGYYFIKDTGSIAQDDSATLYILQVVDGVEIEAKSGTVEHKKNVDDVNDSDADDHSELKDSADYDIGDTIPYTLTATLPSNYDKFTTYYLVFQDDMSEGLTLNADSVKIQYGNGAEQDISFATTTEVTSAYTNGVVYQYEIEDLKTTAPSLKAGDVITITYTVTLNEKAKITDAGNPNRYRIIYSNDPNNSGKGKPTGDTPWDINIVFTYKTVFNKVDGEGKPLSGADFELYKKVGEEWVKVTELHTGNGAKNPTKTTAKLTNSKGEAEGAKFTFAGLDAGNYKIVETETPAGYNKIADQEFTITAEHELVSDNPTLTSLTGTDGAEFTLTPDKENCSLEADIENKSGSVLPSTGGMGTTIFYIVGAMLAIGAAVVLVTKKRMNG